MQAETNAWNQILLMINRYAPVKLLEELPKARSMNFSVPSEATKKKQAITGRNLDANRSYLFYALQAEELCRRHSLSEGRDMSSREGIKGGDELEELSVVGLECRGPTEVVGTSEPEVDARNSSIPSNTWKTKVSNEWTIWILVESWELSWLTFWSMLCLSGTEAAGISTDKGTAPDGEGP